MANQLPPNPTRQLARVYGNRVTSHLTFSIVVVTLVVIACATSTPQKHNQQRIPSLSSASDERHSHLTLKRSPSSPFENNFEPLYERPRVYLNAAQTNLLQQQQIGLDSSPSEPLDFDVADEEFLRQLKEAARYLDDKLAERQRQQQQLAILNQAPGIGKHSLESADQQQQLAYGYQEPAYGVLEERRLVEPEVSTSSQFANGWQALNEVEPDEGDETNVVVLTPGYGSSQLIGSRSPDQVADYKLLVDRLQEQQQQQRQQQSITDARYKQILTSLLLDHAQANSLGSSVDNQKRDSSDAASPAKSIGDLTKTDDVEEATQQEKEDKTEKNKSAAKYTTLLEGEQEVEQHSEESKDAEASLGTASYGKLVYDKANQRAPVEKSRISSEPTSNGSILGWIYSTLLYYFPFFSKLTAWLQNGNTTTEHVAHLAKSTQVGQFETDSASGKKGTGQQAADNELHAKQNVSVSMALDKAEARKDQHNKTFDSSNMFEIDGETNEQKQRENEADGAAQDNQQVQNDDKQLKHGMMNIKLTVDRKRTNGVEDKNNSSSSGGGSNLEDRVVDDNTFTGHFATDDQSAPADAINKRQRDSKSNGLKRDQEPQFVDKNPAELDMSQMVPAAVALDQQGFNPEDDDERDQHQTASRYNMMRHSNLMMPIGASDILVRTAPGDATKEPDSSLGKYIYAPTQHYYLSSITPAGGSSARPLGHHHRVMVQNGKHIQPGDEIYSSYDGDMPMKAYTYHKDRNSIGDKSNDLYFLIMVGAFCVMAMAVVLAAGLFAYRIQNSRKSSQDTDYPTYGVVGPNNMSAKCGAASFVGGYFTGPPSGSSKSGSVKHLPDLYGTPYGKGGSDSGLNSVDKSSNKKASSVSSLNEHHSVSSRAASRNFMAAASQDAARMYHYQHQKQQMIISDRNSAGRQTSASDLDSDDENDDGNYTVYECPGLASAHEMEIKNPLFNDDQSP